MDIDNLLSKHSDSYLFHGFCSHERWAFGDTLEEVVRQAEKRYPEIRSMFGMFKKA